MAHVPKDFLWGGRRGGREGRGRGQGVQARDGVNGTYAIGALREDLYRLVLSGDAEREVLVAPSLYPLPRGQANLTTTMRNPMPFEVRPKGAP